MNQTLVGYFDSRAEARAAVSQLQAAGHSAQISDESPPDAAHATSELTVRTEDDNGAGLLSGVRDFFKDVFGDSHEHLGRYEEGVRRGGCVVKVTVSGDDSRESATDILEGAGAADIDERASRWSRPATVDDSVDADESSVDRRRVRVYDGMQ